MQLEIELDSLAQLESFWGQIPPRAHKAWSQRAQVSSVCLLRLAAAPHHACMLRVMIDCLPLLPHILH